MEKTSRVEKVAVCLGGIEKSVRTTGVKYCGSCKDMQLHIMLKPSAFDSALNGTKTTEVCVGCHEAGRYRGQVVHQFTLPSERQLALPFWLLLREFNSGDFRRPRLRVGDCKLQRSKTVKFFKFSFTVS